MTARIRVRPTKTELIKLKRRLKLTQRVERLLSDKLTLTMMEFMDSVRRAIKLRTELHQKLARAYEALEVSKAMYGDHVILTAAALSATEAYAFLGTRNIMGVKVPIIEPPKEKPKARYPAYVTGAAIDEAVKEFQEALDLILELAEADAAVERLGAEIKRLRRRINMLKYIIIPTLKATIKEIARKFEDREREDKIRLKRIKAILTQRQTT